LQAAVMGPAGFVLGAAGKEFWDSKDPSAWSAEEKQVLLRQSPWAREGYVRMEVAKKRTTPGYGRNGRQGLDMPDTRPGVPAGGVRSVPIGEEMPPIPNPDPGHPVQFRVIARWETAKPVRLAGGPEAPEMPGQFYVIRVQGLPLMPVPKAKPGETVVNPNEAMLAAVKSGSRLERKDKPGIACAHLFTGSGDTANEVLLFFPRAVPIVEADKVVTLESQFSFYHLVVKFPLKEMSYRANWHCNVTRPAGLAGRRALI
jgi:hypothetical protein